jgi:hypothetical protein
MGHSPATTGLGRLSNQATEAKSEPGVAAAIDGQFPRSALREAKQSLSHIDCSDDTDPVSRPSQPLSTLTGSPVISDSSSDEKMLRPGLSFLPLATIVDFKLTISMPPRLTADTGIDVLTHAIEAYFSRKADRFSDGLKLSTIRTIGQNISTSYTDGKTRKPARL